MDREDDEQRIWVSMKLQETPRVGDRIELDFIERTNHNHGYVHSISHHISGYDHEIIIDVHPYNDEYHRWMKLKEKYQEDKLWHQRMRNNNI